MRKDIQDLWTLAEPHVRDAGLDLVEVQFGREHSGLVLRVFIDREAGEVGPVTHEDCERVSRDLSAALDVADCISNAYQLEVSSPGLDRPLRRERDFERFLGESARIRLSDGVEGRRNFSGTLRAVKDGRVEIACDGRSYDLPIDDIARANLVPNWEREFARGESRDRVGEGELRSPEPIAGGAGPSQGPELSRVGEDELRSSEPIAGGAGPSQGPEHKRSAS